MHAKTAIQATVLIWWLIHTVRCQGDSKTGDPMKVNAARFMDVIDRITNEALSFKEVEKFVQTRLEVTGEMKQHNALLEELKQDILGKLKNLTDPVHALKMTIQKYFFGFAQQLADVQDCCHLSIDTTTDIQYNTQVGVNHMCVTHPPASGQEGENAKFATRSVLLQFLTNRATFATTVQFYGTEDGILHLHPATKMATCNNYDPRFANWYIKATTEKKHIVIAIDISAQMRTRKLEDNVTFLTVAKTMVKIILRTLLSDDHFAVFGFNGDGIKLPNAKEDCFKHTFGLATPTNKKRMVEFVDSLSARGTTDYRGGIEKALKFFQTILPTNTATGTATKQVKKNKVFVLVSGTAPREKKRDLEDLVVTGHAQDPQNHIRVVTMGIGLKSKGKATSVMKKLIDKSSKQVGYFYNVESIERPVTQMRKLLGHFTELDQNKTILSEVHSDFINKEPIVTIAQPVVHNGNLVGVVGTDITVAELFFFKKLLNRFEKSYLFVMRRQDNVVFYHPLLPHPALDGSSLVYQIELLEREADKQGILAQMEKLPIGFAKGEGYQIRTPGFVYRDGIQQTKFDALYYWQSFFIGEKIKSAMFTICAVLFDGKDALITLKVPITGAPFTYHVTEKVTLAARHCKYFKRTAISDTTGLKFSTDAFNKPVSDYLSTKDSERDYARILKPRDPVDKKQTLLQDNVIESVEITNKADLEWIWNQKWLGVSYAVWRYIALVFGVFRCYPTVQMPKRFRPKDTEWYRRAISAPNKVMVSPPVLDQMGAGFLITLSKALTTEVTVRKGFPKRQRVLGVMAISITVEYFDTMLKETFHLCKLEGFICFVIDESGYIIVHRHFVIPPTNIPNIPWIENVHITNKEPEIAKHLIQNHYMLNKSCVDLDYQRRHTTYRIQENASLIDNVNADPTFYMERLPGTNMFLVVRTTTLEVPHSCLCESQYGSVTGECNKNRHVACKCPCYTETDRVVMCDDKSVFSYASDWKPCTPLEQTTENSLTDLIDAEEKGHRLLLTCFEYHCAARKNETQCHVYVGCRWCTHNKDGNMLQSPFCTNYFSCYYGRKGFGSPYRAPKNPFLLTNIIIATIVVMLVVTAGLVAYCQNKIEAQRRNSLEDIANKLKYLSEARGKGKHHGPYTDKELKAWQRRKKRLEKAARRKQQKELKEAKKDQSKDQKEAEATPAENIQQMMLSRFQNGIPDKEQCKQQ